MNGCLIGAFALTEADAGSDSNAIQTKAILEKDEYILNGSKTFISNGPIADIFIVFAVTQEAPIKKITAFVIERAFEGVSTSNEIKKWDWILVLQVKLFSKIAEYQRLIFLVNCMKEIRL